MVRSPWTAVALLLALTACAAPPAAEKTPAAPVPVVVEAAPEAPAVAEAQAAVAAAPEPPLEPQTEAIIESAIAALSPPKATPPEPPVPAPAPEPPAAEPELKIDDDPGQLMGLEGAALKELLGEPGYRREDADARVWQYRGHDCMLDVYLYRDGEESPHYVTYYEFRGDGGGRMCFRALLLAQAR